MTNRTEHQMTAHATIGIAPDTKSRVEKLAADTNRSAQDIVTEAVEAYLEFETDYLRRVRRAISYRGQFQWLHAQSFGAPSGWS